MRKATALWVALTVGFIFPFIFFALNDPISVEFSEAMIWFLFTLFPAALIISLKSDETWLLNGMTMLLGVFLGTCVVYGKASAFLIAAVICTMWTAIPVIFGSLFGYLIAVKLKKDSKQ